MPPTRARGADEVHTTAPAAIPYRKGGVDRALVSAAPAAIAGVFPALRYGGIAAFIGIDYGDRAAVTFDANDFHFKKLQLRASHAAPALYFPAVLQLLKDGHVDGPALVTHTFPLAGIAEAMTFARDARDEVIKVVVTV
jgi:L-iditol 2-dehydrogenase